MLQKASEWASILGLAGIVFGGGAFYQKLNTVTEAVKEQGAYIVQLNTKVAESRVEIEQLKGSDRLHSYQLQQLEVWVTSNPNSSGKITERRPPTTKEH